MTILLSNPTTVAVRAPGTSALGVLAASMAPGTWAQLNVSNQNALLADSGATGSMIPYTNTMPWNPLSNVIEICACDHFGGGNPMKHVRYSESTNQFALIQSGIVGGIGHGFDHTVVNPHNGDVYHKPYNSQNLALYRKPYGGSSFSLVTTNSNANATITIGTCWWSGQFAGAGSHGAWMGFASGDDSRLYAYDPLANRWFYTQASGFAPNGSNYDTRMEYSSVKNVAVYGGGGSYSRTLWRLNADGTRTQLPGSAPASVNASSLFVEEPVTGKFLLLSSGRMWELDPTTGTWTQLSGSRAVPSGVNTFPNSTGHLFSLAVAIHRYGVVAFISEPAGAVNGTFYLYKHA